MTLQLFRPVDSDCHCYGVVIDDGDGAFEFYDHDGNLHEDVGGFNVDTTGHAEWVEMTFPPKPDDGRRNVLGADSRLIGYVEPRGEKWYATYSLNPVLEAMRGAFETSDAATGWVLTVDRPRIAALHEAAKS